MIPGKWAENRPLPPSEAQCWLRVTKQLVQGHTSNEKQQSYTQIVLTLEPGFSFTLLFFPSFQLGISVSAAAREPRESRVYNNQCGVQKVPNIK